MRDISNRVGVIFFVYSVGWIDLTVTLSYRRTTTQGEGGREGDVTVKGNSTHKHKEL